MDEMPPVRKPLVPRPPTRKPLAPRNTAAGAITGRITSSKPTITEYIRLTDNMKVHWPGKPYLHGVIIKAGPEQSEVRWANGNVNIIGNDWVKPFRQREPR